MKRSTIFASLVFLIVIVLFVCFLMEVIPAIKGKMDEAIDQCENNTCLVYENEIYNRYEHCDCVKVINVIKRPEYDSRSEEE